MALSKDEKQEITDIINNCTNSDNKYLEQYIGLLSKSIETNSNIFHEMKIVTEEIKNISKEISNGMTTMLKENSIKISQVYKDISSKEGYLPGISTKLNYF
jgi:hypothetical protein